MLSDKLVERLTMLGAMLDEEQRINNKLAYPLTRLLSVITTEGDTAWQSLQQEWQQEVACPDELLTGAARLSEGWGALAGDVGPSRFWRLSGR